MRHLFASLIVLAAFAPAQLPDFTARSELVVLRVSVIDRKSGPITELTKDDFAVFEDGARQPVTLFLADDLPVTVGLIIDNSGSMAPRHQHVVTAALAFAQLGHPDDEFFSVGFNEHIRNGLPGSAPFTHDRRVLQSALARLRPDGQTALYDAVAHGLDYLSAGRHEQKALIVVSDGRDTISTMSLTRVVDKAARSQAVIYAVGLFAEDDLEAKPGALKALAAVTGGEAFFPKDNFNVVRTLERIALDIRTTYTLGYIPSDQSATSRFRKVRVTVPGAARSTRVRHREGYVR